MASLLARIGIRAILWLLAVGWVAACALAWVGSEELAKARMDRTVAQERAQVQSQAMFASANMNQRLEQARSIAMTLALDPTMAAALGRFGPAIQASPLPQPERGAVWLADPTLQPIAQRMTRTVEQFGLNTIWLVNAAGDTVAEGHAPGISPFTGTNYVDREYFKAAQQGLPGLQFAIGRATNVYGLFFSAPVQIAGQFVGMVGVGLSVPKLSPVIEQLNAVVTDDLGVIVLAKDPALLMKTMPGATIYTLSAKERDQRYKHQDFEAVNIRAAAAGGLPTLYQWGSQEGLYVMESYPTDDGALRVYALGDLHEQFSLSQRDQLWWFGLVSLLALLTAGLLASIAQFVITTYKHRATLLSMNEALAREANTDALTGCANRRNFMQKLARERNRSSRYSFDFCLLSMDIDYFKQVNDIYGHAAGDEVLKHFVAIIQTNLRNVDTLGRVGGEEFSILLPQTPAEGGAMTAERIRASVQGSPAVFGAIHIAITVSIGGVEWSASSLQSIDRLLARADEALYAAKLSGRNRVEWAQLCTDSASINNPA